MRLRSLWLVRNTRITFNHTGRSSLLAPRFGRMLSWSLAVGGANDWLQAGFAALTGAANRVQQ